MKPLNKQPIVVALGRRDRAEFRDVIAWLEKHCDLRDAAECDGVTHVVVLQSYPGEFPEAFLSDFREANPDVRIVYVYGTSGDGETRTGRPVPGALRIPWYAWHARTQEVFGDSWVDAEAARALPRYARPESPAAPRIDPIDDGYVIPSLTVGVATGSNDAAALLVETCEMAGHRALWITDNELNTAEVDVAIWDDTCDPRHHPVSLERLSLAVDPSPIVLITNFPRAEDLEALAKLRVRHMLGKPYMIEDLLWLVHQLAAESCGDSLARRAI